MFVATNPDSEEAKEQTNMICEWACRHDDIFQQSTQQYEEHCQHHVLPEHCQHHVLPATTAASCPTSTKEARETLGTLHRRLNHLQALQAGRQEQTQKKRLLPTPKNKAKQFDAKKELMKAKANSTEAAEREIQEHDGMMDGDIQDRIEFFRNKAAMFQGAVWRAQDIFFISKTMALVAYESYVSYVS
jgi:hypothetical protein